MKTIKDIAEAVSKSKTAIMQRIDELGLRSALQTEKNRFVVADDVFEQIVASFQEKPQSEPEKTQTNSQSKSQTTSQSDCEPLGDSLRNEYIEFLKSQIAHLQTENERKNEQISELQKLLGQEQQLRLVADQRILMLTEGQTEQPIIENEPETEVSTEVEPQPKKHWWQFWK